MSVQGRGARIMIVDDDPGVLRAASRVLSSAYEVAEFARPDDAIARVRELRPDIAVCDIRMPGTDGFQLMVELRRRLPDLDVILMTGSHTEPDANLVRALRERAYYFVQKPFHRDVLLTLVERCLETRRLREAQAGHVRRLESELGEARVFQQTMLAPTEGAWGPVRVSARWRACSELGGDFYDYGDLGDGRVAFIVADVRGHGASAALLTAMVKAVFRSGPGNLFDPAGVLGQLAEWLRAFGPERFVTAFCGVADVARRVLTYSNAGHPPAFLRMPGSEPVLLNPTGPLVSSEFEQDSWQGEEVKIGPEGEVFVYTDGVLDAPAGGQRYPREALAAHARSNVRGAELLDAVLGDVGDRAAGRPLGDDVTLLSVVWSPRGS